MALARWQTTIVDEAGNVQDGATVEVRREDPGAPLASLFSDRAGASPIGNPFTAGPDGFASFHVAGGAYRITATKGAFSRTWRYVGVGTSSEFDATDSVAIVQNVSAGFALFFNVGVAAPPGAGEIRFNNASLASATQCFVSAQNAGGSDISDLLMTLFNAGQSIKHRFILSDAVSNTQAVFAITGATDNGSFVTLAVSYVAGAATFPDARPLTFIPLLPGADGVQPGLVFAFNNSTAMADPGNGVFRLNNAALASVTAAAVDDLSALTGTPDVSAIVLSWDDSTQLSNRGTLIIKKASAPQNFAAYRISGASTDNAGWTQLALAHVASAGSIANGDLCVFEFSRTADVVAVATATESAEGILDLATDAEIRGAAAGAHAITANDLQTASAIIGLTDAATIAVNWASFINGFVTLTANRTLGTATNLQTGTWRTLWVQGNDATVRTLTFGPGYLGPNATPLNVSSTLQFIVPLFALNGTDAVLVGAPMGPF